MPQIDWPVRRIRCVTNARVTNSAYFYCTGDDRPSLPLGAQVTHNGAKRWIRAGRNPREHRLSRNEHADWFVDPVPADFTLIKEVAFVTNYPTLPMLVDPGKRTLTSIYNPKRAHGYTISAPRFEGSIEIGTAREEDDLIVSAFIDALSDAMAWFEVPLPGSHLGDTDVAGYDTATGNIKLQATLSDHNLTGWFGRVGRDTCRVVYDQVDWDSTAVRDYHTIRIAPAALITGTTAENAANVFASGATCRARAVEVSANGTTDLGSTWTIGWVETRGEDVIS